MLVGMRVGVLVGGGLDGVGVGASDPQPTRTNPISARAMIINCIVSPSDILVVAAPEIIDGNCHAV